VTPSPAPIASQPIPKGGVTFELHSLAPPKKWWAILQPVWCFEVNESVHSVKSEPCPMVELPLDRHEERAKEITRQREMNQEIECILRFCIYRVSEVKRKRRNANLPDSAYPHHNAAWHANAIIRKTYLTNSQ
jgi:hypothetical protein